MIRYNIEYHFLTHYTRFPRESRPPAPCSDQNYRDRRVGLMLSENQPRGMWTDHYFVFGMLFSVNTTIVPNHVISVAAIITTFKILNITIFIFLLLM